MIVDSESFNLLHSEILRKGGFFRFKARGSSMSPFVRDGAMITVAPVEAVAVRFGDVVFCFFKRASRGPQGGGQVLAERRAGIVNTGR